jgi:hypothetical protein
MNNQPYITAAKLAEHERQNTKPATRFIASNGAKPMHTFSGPTWHLGQRRELLYTRSGLIMKVYYVAKCTGKQLGGCWGQTERDDDPGGVKCSRCFPR